MNNELTESAIATDQKAQYDASAKRLLGHKIILAHILIRVVDEFKGMDAETVVSLIEGDPYISQVSVDPGLTNKELDDKREVGTDSRIVGLNTENSEIMEGVVYFDIIFYVRIMRDGLAKMIINVEAQKDEPTEYDIPVDRHGIREEVSIMCNLSEGVEEMGYARGEAAGKIEGRTEGKAEIILNMYKKGYSLDQIVDVTDMTAEEIKAIIK